MFRRSSVNKDHWGLFFIAPFVITFLIFTLYPIANTFWLAFTDSNLIHYRMRGEFIGLENFERLMDTAMFWTAVTNTWRIWLSNFIPQMILALVLAAMFTSTTFKLKGTGFFKVMYYLPNLMMPVTIAALFSMFLDLHGPVNQFLVGTTGFMAEPRDFLSFTGDTRLTVIFLQTWLWFGQTAIVLVAGMTSISPSFYESALVDGASQVKMFFYITLPLLKPVLLFVLVTSLAGGMQMFEIPMLLTGPTGPPQNVVLTVNMFMNNLRVFPAGMIGLAAAVSVMLFFMSSFITLILFRLFRESSDEREARKAAKKAKKQGGSV